VGGAFIVNLVEAEFGISLWREWAKLEIAGEDGRYAPPAAAPRYAGLVLTLARQAQPDTSAYDAPEVVYRITKDHHAGLIVASRDLARVDQLLDEYARRFAEEFCAVEPAPDSPPA
jgi:hypothetical protein